MKKRTHINTESVEKQSYKLRYLKRKIEEQEADEQIKDFTPSENKPDVQQAPGVEEKGNLRLV